MFPHMRRQWRWWMAALSTLTALLCLCACGGSSGAETAPATSTPTATFARLFTPHHPVRMRADLAYGPAALETLDLCTPTDTSLSLPGIVLIHGGSSTVGDKRDEFDVQGDTLEDACMGLASQGFVVASINYRLAHADPWPAQVEDAQLAVRWLRTHAAELGMDPHHICSVGFSSGAYLAVFLGALVTILPGDRASVLPDQSPQASCVADFYGPVDLAAWVAAVPDSRVEVLDLLRQATPKTNPGLYRSASPLYAISPASAPMLIVQGTSDDTVPEAQSRALEAALKHQHVAVQYISYSGGHVFEGLDEGQVRTIWDQALVFLAAH